MIKIGKLGAIALAGAVGAALATAGYIKHREPVQTPAQAAASSAPSTAASVANYGRIPISFEPNRGQSAGNMAFVARGPGFSLGLNTEGATVRLNRPAAKDAGSQETAVNLADKHAANADPTVDTTATLKLRLVGANEKPALVAENKLPGVSHYLGQTGASGPLTNIPHYAAVRYQQVYPGVDWLLYGNPMKLEYDFIVAPQADPSRIRMRIDGADSLALDETGALLVTVAGQTVRQDKPLVYQERDGQRTAIEASYLLSQPSDAGATEIAFAVADYDRMRALVIDPVLVYSTYLGGTGNESVAAITSTDAGELIVTGTTTSTNFSPTSSLLSQPEVFISQISADGTAVAFTTYLGAGSAPNHVATNSVGEIYVVGLGSAPSRLISETGIGSNCGIYGATFVDGGLGISNSGCLPGDIYPSPITITKSGTIYAIKNEVEQTFEETEVGGSIQRYTTTTNKYLIQTISNYLPAGGTIFLTHTSESYSRRGQPEVGYTRTITSPIWDIVSNDETTLISYSLCEVYSTDGGTTRSGSVNVYGAPAIHSLDADYFLYCDRNTKPIDIAIGLDGNAYSSRLIGYSPQAYEIVTPLYEREISSSRVGFLAANASGNVYYSENGLINKLNKNGTAILSDIAVVQPFLANLLSNNEIVVAISTTNTARESGVQPTNNGGTDLLLRKHKFSDCTDDDGLINFSSTNFSASESSGAINFSVVRSGAVDANCQPFVEYRIQDQSTNGASDLIKTGGIIRWAAGENSTKTVSIPLVNDSAYELQESALVELYRPDGSALGSISSAALLIIDDDPQPSVRLSASIDSISEVSGSTVITATLSAAAGTPVTVPLVYSGTATRNSDYTTPDQIVINPGQLSASVTLNSVDNTLPEPEETVVVTIGTPTSATRGSPDAVTVTIRDNDRAAGVFLSPASLAFGNQALGSTSASQTVVLTNNGTDPLTISFIGASGDFSAIPDCPISLAVGASCNIVTRFVPSVVGPRSGAITVMSNAPTSPNTATLTGTGIDSGRLLSVADVSVTEGNSGTTVANVTVSLSSPSTGTVSARLTTSNNTAIAGSDYVSRNGTISFAAGQTSRVIPITINGDTTIEPNESFFVTMSEPVGAAIGDGQGVVTIVNDDGAAPPTASIGDVSASEGNTGARTFSFTVSLSAAASGPVSLSYATANGSATAGSDYVSSSGSLSFAAGELSKTINVTVNGDTTVEPTETFFVNLSNPSGATLGDSQGQGSIVNDDTSAPALSVNDVSTTEGNSGVKNLTFTISLSPAATGAVTVTAATANGTASSGSDFNGGSLTVSFAAGETAKTVSLGIRGDTTVEPDETFFVNLSNATGGATIADAQGIGTIVNDDASATPTIAINDVSATEGNTGSKIYTFTVSLSAAASGPVTVAYATANATATAGSDYSAASGTLNFAAGITTQTVNVTVNGDTAVEPDETFVVNLSNPSGATIADSQGFGTIVNDDAAATPTLSINDASATEGNSGVKNFAFTVSLSPAATTAVTVTAATSNGTAASGSDFNGGSLSVSFAAGETSKVVNLGVRGDTVVEPNETFFVNLSNPTGGAVIGDGQGLGTIQNDDGAATPTVTIGDVSVTEGNAGSVVLSFPVTLSAASTSAVSVAFATANG
ncbi:Calx-beta domain-containing protein, partial [Nevskia sp.]|uniref:beta strand repeat-containing protein n=1 Tax=Nevskia sp. TaxID=1929292 RepID=UPI0025FB26CF